eukprot:s5901_g2.t1
MLGPLILPQVNFVRSLLQGQPLATCLKQQGNPRAGRVLAISIQRSRAKCVFGPVFSAAIGFGLVWKMRKVSEFLLIEVCTAPQDLKTLTSERGQIWNRKWPIFLTPLWTGICWAPWRFGSSFGGPQPPDPPFSTGSMERFDEGGRTTAKFNWSRSAFASAASKVSTHNVQPTADAVPRSLPDDKVAATLAVDSELGAGLEVEFVEGHGYRVECLDFTMMPQGHLGQIFEALTDFDPCCFEGSQSIRPSPGQPSMRVGDLLVSVNGRSLALTNEDDADEVLANELRHGVSLILQRPSEPAGDELERMDP